MERNRLLLFFLFFLFFCQASAQIAEKHFIYFKNKENTPYNIFEPEKFLSSRALERRNRYQIPITESDLPVNPSYLNALAATGATVLYSSKWFNGALILAEQDQLETISQLSFVNAAERMSPKLHNVNLQPDHKSSTQLTIETQLPKPPNYGNSYNQIAMMNLQYMHAEGYRGEGMLIAVMDAGFENADNLDFFEHLYKSDKIKSTYDFVDFEENVYDDHSHGLNVLSLIGAYKEGHLIGTAYNADFILLRTEDVAAEYRIEEVNWLFAAEYADSSGADIISTSLGYYNFFDDSLMNYTYEDLDGETAFISRASGIAATKGMLLVNSAGNNGNDPWRHINVPADVETVLSVGAVNSAGNYAQFSSVGPTADGRIKPDVMAQGAAVVVGLPSGNISTGSGTSFSAPLVTGFAAGLWQSCPEKSSQEILDIIRRSSSKASNPDNMMGYGIPDYLKAKDIINSEKIPVNLVVGPNPVNGLLNIHVPAEEGMGVEVIIFDAAGRRIDFMKGISIPPYTRFEISTMEWKPGMYLLQLRAGVERKLFKIIKI